MGMADALSAAFSILAKNQSNNSFKRKIWTDGVCHKGIGYAALIAIAPQDPAFAPFSTLC